VSTTNLVKHPGRPHTQPGNDITLILNQEARIFPVRMRDEIATKEITVVTAYVALNHRVPALVGGTMDDICATSVPRNFATLVTLHY
jgi:hypothetical protein